LDLAQLQTDFFRACPAARDQAAVKPRYRKGVRAEYYRLVLSNDQAQGDKFRVCFTIHGSCPRHTLKVLTDHWRKRNIPWIRVYLSQGGSDELPNYSFNDRFYAA
jgi:hypothetical protein